MSRVFKYSRTRITREWLEKQCDVYRVSARGDTDYVFHVEHEDSDNYLHLIVIADAMPAQAQIEAFATLLRCRSFGNEPTLCHVGLFTLQDDISALLEILARGNHF